MKEGRKKWELKSRKWRKEWQRKKKAFYERRSDGRELGKLEKERER